MLNLLNQVVKEERLNMKEYVSSYELWDQIHKAEMPCLVSRITKSDVCTLYAATSIVINTARRHSDILRHVVESQARVKDFLMLPDLVELYMWIHSIFKFLTSAEVSVNLKLDDIMDKETLVQRFDSIVVHSILKLWHRVKDKLDVYLVSCGHIVHWDCEEIVVPFSKIADASLMMLLSESNHPTDGHDYLLIIINEIIQYYNYFILKLNEYTNDYSVVIEEKYISHEKFCQVVLVAFVYQH